MKEKENSSLLINYFFENTKLNKENILYIIDLLFKDSKVLSVSSIESTLFEKYQCNINKIKVTSKDIVFACNIKELLLLLNNSNSYVLFEDINKSNYVYYSILWETVHN